MSKRVLKIGHFVKKPDSPTMGLVVAGYNKPRKTPNGFVGGSRLLKILWLDSTPDNVRIDQCSEIGILVKNPDIRLIRQKSKMTIERTRSIYRCLMAGEMPPVGMPKYE